MTEILERLRSALATRYRVERELGRGGMATVILAHDLKHGRDVAIKAMHPEIASGLGTERFLQEIRTAARLVHPHILALFDSGEAEGLLYYIMPYVDGESLADRIEREGPLPVDDALRIAREVADALAYAHEKRVVHRDIKPGNILLVNGTHACVADFGLAHALSSASSQRLTAHGLTLGSPLYMAPEQIGGTAEVDGRADVYSLGCVLFEMLTGRTPFEGSSAAAVLTRHIAESPPSLLQFRSELPREYDSIVRRALAKRVAQRWASAGEFATALEHANQGGVQRDRWAGSELARGPYILRSLTSAVGRRWALVLSVTAMLAVVALPFVTGHGSSTSTAFLRVAVMPLSDGAALATGEELQLENLFRSSLEIVSELRALDGSSVTSEGEHWSGLPIEELLRRAEDRDIGYLVAPELLGGRLYVSVYRVADGERLMRLLGGGSGEPLESAAHRIALEITRGIAKQENIEFATYLASFPSSVSPLAIEHFLQAQRHFGVGNIDDAVPGFRRAIVADSGFGQAYFRLAAAETWAPRWNYAVALQVLDRGLARRASLHPYEVRLLEAQRHYLMREGALAVSKFGVLATENPRSAEAWFGLGEALFHFSGYLGGERTDALPALEHAAALDTAFAPVYDHFTDLAIRRGDLGGARRYVERIYDLDEREARRAAIALRFGSQEEYEKALSELEDAERKTISILVQLFLDRPTLMDTLSGFLITPTRPPGDRTRGGQYRLVALASQGRWAEAFGAWKEVNGSSLFDEWLVHASFAGFPAEPYVASMREWAETVVGSAERIDLSLKQSPEANALRALTHWILLHGSEAETRSLLARFPALVRSADPTDPEPEGLRQTLLARLALVREDTTGAIEHLSRSLERAPWSISYYIPLSDAAPQRLLLARLLADRGDQGEANRWLSTFRRTGTVGDRLYIAALEEFSRNAP